jgi:hypothetical protein
MKPFLTGRPHAPASSLQSLGDFGKTPVARITGHAHGSVAKDNLTGPTVECIKQGDKVARLVVTCSCGEKIEIECLYPAGG